MNQMHVPWKSQSITSMTLSLGSAAEEDPFSPNLDTYVFTRVRDGGDGDVQLDESGGHTALASGEVRG